MKWYFWVLIALGVIIISYFVYSDFIARQLAAIQGGDLPPDQTVPDTTTPTTPEDDDKASVFDWFNLILTTSADIYSSTQTPQQSQTGPSDQGQQQDTQVSEDKNDTDKT